MTGSVAKAGAAAPAPPAGKGTAGLAVTAFSISVDGAGEVGTLVTTGRSTTDHQRAGVATDGASADLTGVVATSSDGQRFMSPYPPVRSESAKGHDLRSEGDANVVAPPPSEDGAAGTLATGNLRPARIETWLDDGGARSTLASEADTVDVLGGLSHLEGAGPGDHQTWAAPDEVGAAARALKIRSATLLEAGGVLEALGLDVAGLPDDVVRALANALGVGDELDGALPPGVPGLLGPAREETVEAVASAPLLAVADVSATVGAVATVATDGTVLTSAHGAGSVGSIRVGANELGGFDLSQTAQDWNALEAETTMLLNSVLATLGDRYADLARVRVAPVVVQETTASGGYAISTARVRLLDVQVNPPQPDPDGLDLPDTDGLTDEFDAVTGMLPDLVGLLPPAPDVDDVSGGVADGVLGRSEVAGGIAVALVDMEATAEHTRPGIALRCESMCDGSAAVLNRPWAPEAGFALPTTLAGPSISRGIGGGNPGAGQGALPRTGIPLGSHQLAGSGLALAALVGRRIARPIRQPSAVIEQNGVDR
jgi:hypothetical protein